MNNIRVVCRTNLDLQGEQWPTEMPAIPSVGHKIMSRTKWNNFQLVLEVIDVTWEFERELEEYVKKNPKIKHKNILIPNGKDFNIYRGYFEAKGFRYFFVNYGCFNLSW